MDQNLAHARLGALRQRLANEGADAFLSIAPPDNQYLTGFSGSTSAVLVSAEHKVFFCDFRYTEQAAQEVAGYPVEQVDGPLLPALAGRLVQWQAKSVTYDPANLTVAQLTLLQKTLGGVLKPLAGPVLELRTTKVSGEVDAVRAASALAEGVLADLLPTLRAGVTERDVAARMEYEFKCRGAQGASFDSIVLFGARSSLPHGKPGDRALQSGDIVLMDFGCRMDGYCSDLTRTYAFGRIPGEWFGTIYDLVLTAQEAALRAIRPGMRCCAVDAVARDIISKAGYGNHFGHGLGHGVGIEIHEEPRLRRDSDVVLEEGMVVTVEPGIYLPGQGGVRIEDLVVVVEGGCELLSHAPKGLRVLPE